MPCSPSYIPRKLLGWVYLPSGICNDANCKHDSHLIPKTNFPTNLDLSSLNCNQAFQKGNGSFLFSLFKTTCCTQLRRDGNRPKLNRHCHQILCKIQYFLLSSNTLQNTKKLNFSHSINTLRSTFAISQNLTFYALTHHNLRIHV